MKKILVLGTGGTIASKPSEEGLKPGAEVSELLAYVPEAKDLCELHMIQVLNLDSTNMRPEDWKLLVRTIEKYYMEFDGFLILHGTDTMAYTAAALSYMIQNSKKPIVLTGSQRPMGANRTDAKENIYQSIRYLIHEKAFGVNIVFADMVIPGARARKEYSHSLKAFACVDDDCRAVFKDDKLFINEECSNTKDVAFYHELNDKVLLWKIIPGMRAESLLSVADSYDAIVIEGFGLGGLPDLEKCNYFPVIDQLIRLGKIVVITTQVPYEGTDMSVYEVGMKYKTQLDILEGHTMTAEAIVTKLMWLLGQTKDMQKIKKCFGETINRDIRKFEKTY